MTLKSELHEQIRSLGLKARAAYAIMAEASNAQKDMALAQAALTIRKRSEHILAQNAKDVAYGREKGLDAAMIDRLTLEAKRV